MKNTPYGKQFIDEYDHLAIHSCLQSDYLTTGPEVEKFEKMLCKISGARYAVACSNGTTALHLACYSIGINENSLGITTPITFLASANCIEYCGGTTDFVDIDPQTRCLSPQKLEEYCENERVPDVVIPVDFAGVPADLPAIWKLAQKYGFKVIEDAAHSIGSTYLYEDISYNCGSCVHSDLAIFSFHPVKSITTGEGGAVLTNDPLLYEKLLQYRNHGMVRNATQSDEPWGYSMENLGFNYRITDLQCALGNAQLQKLPYFKERRAEIKDIYDQHFCNNDKLQCYQETNDVDPCYHLYVVEFTEGVELRKKMYEELHQRGILVQVHYTPVYFQPYYRNKYGYQEGKCPNSEKYYQGCLSLPLFPSLINEEVLNVVDSVKMLLHKTHTPAYQKYSIAL